MLLLAIFPIAIARNVLSVWQTHCYHDACCDIVVGADSCKMWPSLQIRQCTQMYITKHLHKSTRKSNVYMTGGVYIYLVKQLVGVY